MSILSLKIWGLENISMHTQFPVPKVGPEKKIACLPRCCTYGTGGSGRGHVTKTKKVNGVFPT